MARLFSLARAVPCTLPFALVALALLGACGDDDDFDVGPLSPVVGGPCHDELDCVSGALCLRGPMFPDGSCALPCRGHADCPYGTACIDVERGACVLECRGDIDCRGGYECKERDDRDDPGASLVCVH